MTKLKHDAQFIEKHGLYYTLGSDGRLKKFRPWLGDSFSFLYDFIMHNSVFPKKFGSDIKKHYDVLNRELVGYHEKHILELGTGSGSAAQFLSSDNRYTGTDISPGLLKQAVKRFSEAGFRNPEFYVVSAHDLPFENGTFDVCLCILSLNFIGNVQKVFQEIHRVLLPNGIFVCSVPIPERNLSQRTIRGVLYTETELEKMCQGRGFRYQRISYENGALLYFKAIKGDNTELSG